MEDLKRQLVDFGVATMALDQESESGDKYLVHSFDQGILLALVDGLGHGTEAAIAAGRAVQTLKDYASEPVVKLTQRCHRALQRSRGAAMSLARVDTKDSSMSWIAIGNVSGLVVHADHHRLPKQQTLMMRAGVVGHTLPALQASAVPIDPGDLLIFITDGVALSFSEEVRIGDSPQQIADRILRAHHKGTDDATALVVRFQVEGT